MLTAQLGNQLADGYVDTSSTSEERVARDGGLMERIDTDTLWMADGLCRDKPPAVFFPSDGVGVDRARKICASCPVRELCLEYALDNRIDHGVWGGTSERERRRILKRRRIASVVG